MRKTNESKVCECCGAPVTSEICQYCGTPTGLDTARANMDYPVIECKEAVLNFWNLGFPAIFAFGFGFAGVAVFVMIFMSGEQSLVMAFMSIPFLVVGIVSAYQVIRILSRYIKVKAFGKEITATVYGYMDDNMLINGVPAQVVKLLVQTAEGPRFIVYQLGDTKQIYGVNTKIQLIVYQNYFLINKKAAYINWG